jgi:hypothetical protein
MSVLTDLLIFVVVKYLENKKHDLNKNNVKIFNGHCNAYIFSTIFIL